MRRVPPRAARAQRDALRALRLSDGLAGGAVRGVRRTAPVVLLRPGRGRLRRSRPQARGRMERARHLARRGCRHRPRCRDGAVSTGRGAHFRPRRGGPRRLAWREPGRGALPRLGVRWGLPAASLLARTRRVRPQRGLTRPERSANVQAAFRTVTASPRSVGLIDDVYTTGATVGAAARELRRAGARTVHVVTFARVVRG